MERKKAVGMLVMVLVSMVGLCWGWGWQEMTKGTVKESLSDSGLDNFLEVIGQKFQNAREAAKDMMDKGGVGALMSASDLNQVDNGRETMAYREDKGDDGYDEARHEAHHAEEKVAGAMENGRGEAHYAMQHGRDEAHHAKDEIADANEHGTDTIDYAKEPMAETNQNARDKAVDANKKGSKETKEAHGSSADRIFREDAMAKFEAVMDDDVVKVIKYKAAESISYGRDEVPYAHNVGERYASGDKITSEDALAKFEAWKEKAYHVISDDVAWILIKAVESHGKDEVKASHLIGDDVAKVIDKAAAHAYNEIEGYTYASGEKIMNEDLMAKFSDKIMGGDVMAKFEALTDKASYIIAAGVDRILKDKAAESISRGRDDVSHIYNEVGETYVSGDKIMSEDVIAKFEALIDMACLVIANDIARIVKDKAAESISHGDEVSHATYEIMSEELKPKSKAWEGEAASAIGDDVAIKHKAAESTSHRRNEVSDSYNEAINKVRETYGSADKIMSKDAMAKFEAAMEQASHALGTEQDSNAYDEAKNEYAAADKILSMDAMAKYEAAKEKASQAMGDLGAKMRANMAEV